MGQDSVSSFQMISTFLYPFDGPRRLDRCSHAGKDKRPRREACNSGKGYDVQCRQNAGAGGTVGKALGQRELRYP